MRLRLVALPAATLLVAAVGVVPSVAGAATAQCTYTPVLPKRIAVNKAPTTFHTPVKIGGTVGGSACAKSFSAQETLSHKSDSYTLAWQYNSRTASNSVLPITVVPGTYKTPGGTNCTADTSQDMTCAVEPGSTVIKFAGKTHLAAARLKGKKNDKVQFAVTTARYDQYNTVYVSAKVAIQRYGSGSWHTIHTGTTSGKHGYVWTYTNDKSGTYRAVSSDTKTSFGATSGRVTK